MAAAAQAGLLQQQAELERKAAELEKKERELQSNAASINRECRSRSEGCARGSLPRLACRDLRGAQPVQAFTAFYKPCVFPLALPSNTLATVSAIP